MTTNSLESVIEGLRAAWGPLTTETVDKTRGLLAELARTSLSEEWLASLLHEEPVGKELYRDPKHGFILLAYTEKEGQYRPPHDHGSGWVVYAVRQGEIEMGSYHRIDGEKEHLVKKDSYLVRTGDSRLYLPGDIHDTRCASRAALVLRFTSCDLRREESEGRLTRYTPKDGAWIAGSSR